MTAPVAHSTDLHGSGGGRSERILLICSRFFAYHERIEARLRELGFDVVNWDDRASHTTLYKLFLRKQPLVTGLATASRFTRRIAKLERESFEHILIVKGEGLSVPVARELRRRFPRARMSLYLWDALRNTRNAARIAPFADSVATFDPDDAEREGWLYRPLFAEPSRPSKADPVYDWSFVGTIHSDRARVIRRFRASLSPKRRGFVFGYFPSVLLQIAHAARDPKILWDGKGELSRIPMLGAEAARIIEGSRAVLDIEHPSQVGLTMRSIETILSGRKLITTNRTIGASALAHPTRVAVIDRHEPRIDDAFFDMPFEPVPENVVRAYSLEGWAHDVLGLRERPSTELDVF